MKSVSYDLDLFRELNEQYRETPLVPQPPGRSPASYEKVAQGRIDTMTKYVDVAGKRVLELGTGRGYTAARLCEDAGAEHATGIDIREYEDWPVHDATKTRFVVGDLASEKLVEDGSVDVVVSAVVFEHVTRPVRMLEAVHEALSPGGTAWLYFNLHRGPKASHRYRDVYFPWPHLLFEDLVGEQAIVEAGSRGRFAWVNCLTAADYFQVCSEIGFEITAHRRHTAKLVDHLAFYDRFEDKLGRYPALDLETDFLTIALRKADGPVASVPVLGYAERQRQFDAALAEHRRAASEQPGGPADR